MKNLFALTKKQLLSITLIIGLLVSLVLALRLAGTRQEIRKKAAGAVMSLSLYPVSETIGVGQAKLFELKAAFSGGSSTEKLDYFKTELSFNPGYIKVPEGKYLDTGESGFGKIIRVDGPQAANESGKIIIELGAGTPGTGPSTDKPVTIAKLYFEGKGVTPASQDVKIGQTQAVNNQSSDINVTSQSAKYLVTLSADTTPTPTPTSIPSSCLTLPQSDTFTGSTISAQLWDEWRNNGSVNQTGGVLQTAVPGGNGYAGVITKNKVCGDFDVTVNFSQFTNSGQPEADVRLSIEENVGMLTVIPSTVFIERFVDGDTSGFRAIKVISGGQETQFAAPVTGITQTSGKLRIRRVGSTYTLYYDIGSGWQSFLPANAFSADANIALIVKSWKQNPSVSASFDNFNLTAAILDPSITSVPSATPSPTSPTPIPPSGREKYIIDAGDKQSLVINIGPSVNPQIKFKAKLASLRAYPELYLKLRVKDELAFMDRQNSSTVSTDTCNNPTLPDRDFLIPMKATGDIYSPVQQISQPVPAGAIVASVGGDGWVILDGMVPGRYYTLYLKGPKTRKSKVLEHFLLQPNQVSTQDFDWTGKLLDPGDLPDPANGMKQDCTINSADWSLEKARIGSTDGDNLAVCDVNYDGICNAGDSVAILDTLSKRPDDDQ